jgi:catechol 2,3-dioxygenase-like lactoylglutathione lyase family enzyme
MLSTPGREDLLALTYAVSGPYLPFGGGGVDHIGFIFESDEDVRTAVDAIQRYGGSIVRTGEREQGGFHEIYAYVADPDGYKIEMCTQLGILGLKRSLEKKRTYQEAAEAAAPVTAT